LSYGNCFKHLNHKSTNFFSFTVIFNSFGFHTLLITSIKWLIISVFLNIFFFFNFNSKFFQFFFRNRNNIILLLLLIYINILNNDWKILRHCLLYVQYNYNNSNHLSCSLKKFSYFNLNFFFFFFFQNIPKVPEIYNHYLFGIYF